MKTGAGALTRATDPSTTAAIQAKRTAIDTPIRFRMDHPTLLVQVERQSSRTKCVANERRW